MSLYSARRAGSGRLTTQAPDLPKTTARAVSSSRTSKNFTG